MRVTFIFYRCDFLRLSAEFGVSESGEKFSERFCAESRSKRLKKQLFFCFQVVLRCQILSVELNKKKFIFQSHRVPKLQFGAMKPNSTYFFSK